jgi:hypothetical protein
MATYTLQASLRPLEKVEEKTPFTPMVCPIDRLAHLLAILRDVPGTSPENLSKTVTGTLVTIARLTVETSSQSA